MIRLKKPNFNQAEILDTCLSSMRIEPRKGNILASKINIIDESNNYDKIATKGELYTITPNSTVKGGATADDMKALYIQKFVPENQNGRIYYDAIMLLAPSEKCPYCGQQIVKTLDHYLPQAEYPTYTVTPYNLVPACSDCNKNKLSTIYTCYEEQSIHPYYDDFTDAIWIKAKLVEEEPITFEFYADNPVTWDEQKCKRAKKHFEYFKLNKIYKVYAASEYIACENRIKKIYVRGGKAPAVEFLEDSIEDKRCIMNNKWESAMYQAIIDSSWYWDYYIKTKV